MFYSFHNRDLIPVWLNVFLGVFVAIVNGIAFFIYISDYLLFAYAVLLIFMCILYPVTLLNSLLLKIFGNFGVFYEEDHAICKD
jgi:hypothetical protein